MTWWHHIYLWVDLLLISPYRGFDNPVAGFYFGTFMLCLWCMLIGGLTLRFVSGVNREHLKSLRKSMIKMHNLSIKALMLKDKENYRACNKEANEAFGKYFFNTITLGAAMLWPIPFALAWMNTRFGHVRFDLLFPLPFLGDKVGFSAVMIPLYILCRILWAKIERRFGIKIFKPDSETDDKEQEEMITLKEVDMHGGVPERFWHR